LEKSEKKEYFKTDEYEDFFSNWTKLYRTIKSYILNKDKDDIKWSIIFIFMTLQNLFILCLRQSNNFSITKGEAKLSYKNIKYTIIRVYNNIERYEINNVNSNEKKISIKDWYTLSSKEIQNILEELGIDKKISEKKSKEINEQFNYLCNFSELYKRVKLDDFMKMYVNSKPLKSVQEYDYSIKKINSFRNNFIHFAPQTWFIELSGINNIFCNCICIMEELICETNMINTNYPIKEKWNEAIEQIKELKQELKLLL